MKNYRSVSAIILERSFEGKKKYLLVRKPRKNHAWQFPQGGVDEGETSLDAARRELNEECGSALQVEFLSEKPVGVYQYDFPIDFKRHDADVVGARVEFFSAKWISGDTEIDENEVVEAQWVTSSEMKELVDAGYWEVVKLMLNMKG